MERVPRNLPVMLLPNHQNGLLDPLIYAAFAKARKPYFLTRSDVFQGKWLQAVFDALRMIPIYRMRDGRHTLKRNEEVFDRCSDLLAKGEHVLLFPEASHNLNRQVRTLSKGFTRIVLQALEQQPEMPLHFLPVGINYQAGAGFPDRVAYFFGEPIAVQPFLGEGDPVALAAAMKQAVFDQLVTLTTHADPDREYEAQISPLERAGADFLQPQSINAYLQGKAASYPRHSQRNGGVYKAWDLVFRVVNAPVLVLWKKVARAKVQEPEFMSTYRFGFAFFAFPVYLALLAGIVGAFGGWEAGATAAGLLLLHNLFYVKFR